MSTRLVSKSLLSVLFLLAACSAAPEPAAEASSEPPPSSGAEEVAAPEAAAAEPAPEAAPPAAQPAAPEEPDTLPYGVVVLHKVKDFDAWKTAFDGHEQARRDAAIAAHGIARSVDDRNTVMVWLGGTSLDDLKSFTSSKDLKAAMKSAGVIGAPKIFLMETADSKPGSPEAKYGMFVRHTVADYDAWKTAFDQHEPTRTEAGLVGYDVGTDPENPNKVYVWSSAADAQTLKAFTSSADLKAAMKEAGVKGKPDITIVELVEMKFYE